MDKSSIKVAEYLTKLPDLKLLETKLHQSIERARNRWAQREGGQEQQKTSRVLRVSSRSAMRKRARRMGRLQALWTHPESVVRNRVALMAVRSADVLGVILAGK